MRNVNPVRVILRNGREKPVLNGHPWVFSGAIERCEPAEVPAGSPCEVFDSRGNGLASGYINPASQITCRLVSRVPGEYWGAELLRRRLEEATAFRDSLGLKDTDCLRLVNAEGDGLPGIVVDRYGEALVLELTTAGAEGLRRELVEWLGQRYKPSFIYENSGGPARSYEGLAEVRQALAGVAARRVAVTEYGHRFQVDPLEGQKTGFYLDQRENRRLAAAWMKKQGRALNLFSYTGAFAVYLAAAGASAVTSVETSEKALELAGENLRLNGFSAEQHPLVRADAFEYLRGAGENSGRFDLVVVDPPPLARQSAHVDKASRAYKDINRLALGCIAGGGILLTFTCSGHIGAKLFRQIVFAAAVEANRRVRVLSLLGAGPDHPVSLFHPEGEYLSGLLLQVS